MSVQNEEVFCQNTSSILADTDTPLTNMYTNENAVLPQGALVKQIIVISTSPLTSGGTVSFGTSADSSQSLIPSSVNLTTDNLNARNVVYAPVGLYLSPTAETEITVRINNATSGTFELYIAYDLYTSALFVKK